MRQSAATLFRRAEPWCSGWELEVVPAAVFGDRLFDNTLPTGQVVSLQLFEDAALGTLRATIGPPLQPLGAECVNAEVKETGKRDTHDWIHSRTADSEAL